MNSTSSIITIGREYGSGGRQIGQEVAKYFGIKCYDKELLEHAANESGICKELFENHDERPTNSFLYSLVMDTYSFGYSSSGFTDMPMNHKVFLAQFDAIKKLASEGPCVMVGRCADYALSEYKDCFSVFVHADTDWRINRLSQKHNKTAKEAKDIDATDIRGFLYAYKQSRGISNLSLNNKRSAISSFFSWLADEEYIDKDPTRKIKKIKVTKKKKKAFTADEMERMRIACTDIRDRALIEMLASTGCRVSELSSIRLNDIDFIRKKVRIIGKGDKERTVFISDQAMIYLNRYLETRQDNNISLFVSKRHPYNQLKKDGIERIVRDLGKSCNVYAHPHKFRRTLCTQLIKRGMPLQDVAILLGHADINMTAGTYYDASDDMIEYEYIRYAA